MSELKKLRLKIDEIDHKILDLLNKRAEVALEVGKTKQDKQLKIHSPERERAILKRLMDLNPGPFPNDTLKVVYEEIISASLALQQPLKVAYLGPSATFTHLAARRKFGSSSEYMPESTIKEVFESVLREQVQYGVIPIENSTGARSYVFDFLNYLNSNSFKLELTLKKDIKKIYTHPQARAQCRAWLTRNFPHIPIMEELSTSAAAKRAAKNASYAAVASELAASVYNLKFVEKSIEDNKSNYTRFLVIAKESPGRTGKDKTSVMLSLKDKPGALYLMLRPFAKHKINLTKIESRPSRRKAWEYLFFVDMAGHIDDREVKKAINDVTKECLFLKVLGSYPSAE